MVLKHAVRWPNNYENVLAYILPWLHRPCIGTCLPVSRRSIWSHIEWSHTGKPYSSTCQYNSRCSGLLAHNMSKLVDELLVECSQRPEGCTYACQRQLLVSHLKDSCQYVQVPCSESDCDQVVLRGDKVKHGHDCGHRLTECDGCGNKIKHTDIEVSFRSRHKDYLFINNTCIRAMNLLAQQRQLHVISAQTNFPAPI